MSTPLIDSAFEETLLSNLLRTRVYDLAKRTPLQHAPQLSARTQNHVSLKREDLQPAFSFKIRGAYNRLVHLSEAEKAKGVICVSAGNHAQGVALAAKHLGITATVIMPRTAPSIKVNAVQMAGARVILAGDSYNEAAQRCSIEQTKSGAVLVHPFDDPLVIAGQGTIGLELFQQAPDLKALFVPVGGGGLLSGIGGALKLLKSNTKLIGVEPEDSNAMEQSLAQNTRVILPNVGRFADGVAVAQVGEWTFEMAKRYVDDMVLVSVDEICFAIKLIYEDTRTVVEPAGALGVAGLCKYVAKHGWRNQQLAAVNSGANTNFDRLQFMAERAVTGSGQEAIFAVTIPEKRGALRIFCQDIVAERNITEFNYRLSGRQKAQLFLGLACEHSNEHQTLKNTLQQHDYPFVDLTANNLAKTHIRHMVGGRSDQTQNERLFHFQFPERPKALLEFLQAMSPNWNISLFHYRMHGADFGRVLMGLEIPRQDTQAFDAFLNNLGFAYQEETENPAYHLFL